LAARGGVWRMKGRHQGGAGPQVEEVGDVVGEQHVEEEQLTAVMVNPDGNPRWSAMGRCPRRTRKMVAA
jgi:hypothetical protein